VATQLSPRQRRLIRELCGGYRRWAPRDETAAPRLLGPLHGGFSNLSVVLAGSRHRYVLRLGSGSPRPGVDREREKRLLQRAAKAGIAPPPLYCDPRRQLLITPLLPCRQPEPTGPAALAALLRHIHALPGRGAPLNGRAHLQAYLERLGPDPTWRQLLGATQARVDAASAGGGPETAALTTCHNDLLSANRCHSGGKLLALDWEYAAPGDPFFDLAVCASEFDEVGAQALLHHYLERRPSPEEKRHYSAQRLLYAALEAGWWAVNSEDRPRTAAARARLAARLESENR